MNFGMRFGSIHQENWDWRAAGNFMFGGTGGSLMFMTAAANFPESPPAALGLASLVIVAAGLGLVWLEIGRPMRFLNVYFNLRTSWMTREAAVAAILFVLALAGVVLGQSILIGLAGLAGLAFVYCQAMMLKASKGIPAWRLPAIVPLVISTGLSEGTALLLLIILFTAPAPDWLSYLLLAFVILRALAWSNYKTKLAGAKAPKASLDVLAGINLNMQIFGGALPVILILLPLAWPDTASMLNAIAAALVVLTGWYMKFTIVTRAAQTQGYALGQPRRLA